MSSSVNKNKNNNNNTEATPKEVGPGNRTRRTQRNGRERGKEGGRRNPWRWRAREKIRATLD